MGPLVPSSQCLYSSRANGQKLTLTYVIVAFRHRENSEKEVTRVNPSIATTLAEDSSYPSIRGIYLHDKKSAGIRRMGEEKNSYLNLLTY